MKEPLGRTDACIAYERFGEELTAAEQQHLASCSRCQAELALARSFESGEALDGEDEAIASIVARLETPRAANVVSMSARRKSNNARPLLAVAATLLVALSATFLVQQRRHAVEQTGGITESYRSLRVRVLAPSGDVAAPPADLSWAPVANADAYDISIVEVDGTTLWQTTTRSPRAALPPAVVARFVPSKSVLWQVTARRGGAVLADSGAVKFRVVPR